MKDIQNICTSIEVNDQKISNPVAPIIVQTSSFRFENYQHYLDVNCGKEEMYSYTRDGNPTTAILEEKIAALEGGEKARAFASGMGAISATIFSLLKQGDHVIVVNTVYTSSVKVIQSLKKFGIESSVIHVNETQEIFDYVNEQTKMIYFESPSSQKFEMLDLKQISNFARKRNIYTVIDNTWSTPLFQNPLNHGIDVVIHSCSKYIGGHSDIVGGIVVANKEIVKTIDEYGAVLLGASLSPHDAWLAIRGLRTLPIRMKSQQETIIKVLDCLKNDSRIKKIYHPYIQQKELASTYLNGYSSLFGMVLDNATPQIIERFVNHLHVLSLAYSWGGFESLILPAFKGNNEEEMKKRGLDLGHFRVYLGLEDSNLLINDILSALDYAYEGEEI